MTNSPLEGLRVGLAVLEATNTRYAVVGSVASSIVGVPRATVDADLILDVDGEKLDAVLDGLTPHFYLDRGTAHEALERLGTFNAIHEQTGYKLDFYFCGMEAFAKSLLSRRIHLVLADGLKIAVSTAEDLILSKLQWYVLGRRVSSRQVSDVQGLLRMNPDVDRGYLKEWGTKLGLADLLDELLADSTSGA